jgi:hypothetical protein
VAEAEPPTCEDAGGVAPAIEDRSGKVADLTDAVTDLDWEGFSAEYFPESRRHNLKALAAYGAYKRSRVVDKQTATEAVRPQADRVSEAASVEAWENEGGASH